MSAIPSSNHQLLEQSDWPFWWNYIKKQAKLANIWEFVNPDVELPQLPVNTRPNKPIYQANDATSTASSNTPIHQPSQMDYTIYRMEMDEFKENQRNLAIFTELIQRSVGPKFARYLTCKETAYEMLQELQKVARPSEAVLLRDLENDITRRNQGPKQIGLQEWLQLHITIIQKAEYLAEPPPEAQEFRLVKNLVQDCKEINPLLYHEYGRRVLVSKPSEIPGISDLIAEFNLIYEPPARGRAAYSTLSGRTTDQPKCMVDGRAHQTKDCKNLFESLQPDGWIISDRIQRQCQEFLKTSDGRKFYEKRKK
jgi:hypothetical protein